MAQTDNRLSAETVRTLAAFYPDWDPESVVRISWRESNFVPTVIADDSDDLSYGLMQINMKEGTADIAQLRQMFGITRNEELLNPVVNMRAAHVLWLASGKSFIPSWGIVPPIANYPTTGGSNTINNNDGQGEPISPLTAAEEKKLADWINTHTALVAPWDSLSVKLRKEKLQEIIDEAGDEIPPDIRALMDKYITSAHEPGVGEVVSQIPGNVAGGLLDNIPGLGTLLSTLTSLGFWKKVGVGAIALLFILIAVAMFNKDKIVPIVTKGAMKSDG